MRSETTDHDHALRKETSALAAIRQSIAKNGKSCSQTTKLELRGGQRDRPPLGSVIMGRLP